MRNFHALLAFKTGVTAACNGEWHNDERSVTRENEIADNCGKYLLTRPTHFLHIHTDIPML